MSGQHTPGRLVAMAVARNDFGIAGPYCLASDKTSVLGKIVVLAGGLTEADARRLAACWNACDGLSIENLESNIPIKEGLRGLNAQLRAARALLADAADTFDENQDEDHEIADRIRAFLKGGV